MTYNDEHVAAYVDGELGAAEREALERAARGDASLARRVQAELSLRSMVAGHYAPVLAEPVPAQLSGMIAGGPSAEVVSLNAHRGRQGRSPRSLWQAAAALAATLALGIVAGQQMSGGKGALIGSGAVVADAGLRAALDEQLASNQPQDATVRIGLSFADAHGGLCRTFDSADLAGVACREGADWRLRFGAPGDAGTPTEYRQAASAGMLVMQAAEAMMQGSALDPQEERAARDRGWRASR